MKNPFTTCRSGQSLDLSRLPIAVLFAAIAWLLISQPVQAQTETGSTDDTMQPVKMLPEIPDGITSFGAALCDGHLYVYGGHNGDAHEYYQTGQNGTTWRLDLQNPGKWESVSQTVGRQGLAMVAHNGRVYRLGGFEARNQQGEEHDLHSVATVEVMDADSGEWQEIQPMPAPRSSFDAVVVGDTVYVVGGWAMAGDQETRWLETACSLDLSDPDAQWQQLPTPPFVRRALSTAAHGEKIYVIGGMQEKGGPTRSVDVFDTATSQWSKGPELPGDKGMEGFGNSSFNVGGQVVVTTYSGQVYQLNSAGDEWLQLGSLESGRFFHRLLPVSDAEFVLIGGASMESGKTTDTPVFAR